MCHLETTTNQNSGFLLRWKDLLVLSYDSPALAWMESGTVLHKEVIWFFYFYWILGGSNFKNRAPLNLLKPLSLLGAHVFSKNTHEMTVWNGICHCFLSKIFFSPWQAVAADPLAPDLSFPSLLRYAAARILLLDGLWERALDRGRAVLATVSPSRLMRPHPSIWLGLTLGFLGFPVGTDIPAQNQMPPKKPEKRW